MPSPTYTPLANLTLSSTASSVTFSSISSAYRDLVLVSSTALSSGSAQQFYRFNGDSGANYSYVFMETYSTTTVSTSWFGENRIYAQTYSSEQRTTQGNAIMQIMDYSATDKHKTALIRMNTDVATIATAGRWANTTAITSITTSLSAGTWVAGSTFALYGIAS